jgi:hypothetical protein
MPDKPSPANYRATRRNEERRLVIWVIVILVVVGDGLIGLIWGAGAALTGGLCLLGGATLIGGLWLLLSVIQKFVDD